MIIIKLMPDYQCYPLWSTNGKGNIDPLSLPLSNELRERLNAWARKYDATLNIEDPVSSGFQSLELEDSFIRDGNDLAGCLQKELGAEYQVVYSTSTIR